MRLSTVILELSQASPNTKFRAEWKAISVEGWAANSSLYVNEGYSAIRCHVNLP